MTAGRIITYLSQFRLDVQDEKHLQQQIADAFFSASYDHEREYRLDGSNIVDFMLPGKIAIEVKIKGSRREIFKQCERYCHFDEVSELILITNRSIGFPKEINRKPCYVMALGRSWL